MAWEILWPLILGFALSGVVQALVSQRSMARLLGDDSPRSLLAATLFGSASSSCSYGGSRVGPVAFRQGGELHRGYGLRARLDQSRHRARRHPRRPPRLAV